jgi:hypothetical protein
MARWVSYWLASILPHGRRRDGGATHVEPGPGSSAFHRVRPRLLVVLALGTAIAAVAVIAFVRRYVMHAGR